MNKNSQSNPLLDSMADLSKIDDVVLADFIETGLEEGYTVELKDYSKDPNLQYDIRQTIASFANRQGGFLLVGVKDKKNVKASESQSIDARINNVNHIDEPRQWVDEICSKNFMQPIARYEVETLRLRGKEVVVIKVPVYTFGPVAIKKDVNGLLEFWQRGNGSNLKMDYISISEKFDSSKVPLIEAAIVDLMHEYGDLGRVKKLALSGSFNPIRLSSMIVEGRRMYYGLLSGSSEAVRHIHNLKNTEHAINEIIDMCNKSHINQRTIDDVEDIEKVLLSISEKAEESVIGIVLNLIETFPEITRPRLQALFKKHGVEDALENTKKTNKEI